MTIDKEMWNETINKKFEEIDEKLKNPNLTEEQKQILLEEQAEYEEQAEDLEYYPDTDKDDEEIEDDEMTFENIYFKYCFEECKTIDEILEQLDNLKSQFEQLKLEGHELLEPVNNGFCLIDKLVKN
jgi:hypothetical protein